MLLSKRFHTTKTLTGSRPCWRAIAVSQNSVSQNIYILRRLGNGFVEPFPN
jgi:hypothetical protein